MNKVKTRIYNPPDTGITSAQAETLISNTLATDLVIYPKWARILVDFNDLSANNFTRTIDLEFDFSSSTYIHDVKIIPTEDFSGGLIATYTLSVGISGGSNTVFAIATNVFTGNSTLTAAHVPIPSIQSTDTIILSCTAISTIGLLNTATTGAAAIWVLYSQLVKL